jgi:hypothetical protein
MAVMDEIRRLAPLEATLALVALGFEPIQAARLVALRLRLRLARDEQDAPAATTARKRLRFARWLVRHGRLSDGLPAGRPEAPHGAARPAGTPRDTP